MFGFDHDYVISASCESPFSAEPNIPHLDIRGHTQGAWRVWRAVFTCCLGVTGSMAVGQKQKKGDVARDHKAGIASSLSRIFEHNSII